NHQRTITHRIARQDQENNLPDNGEADEAVVILGMSDRRRIIMSGALLEKILRQQHDQTVDTGNKKNNLRKFHQSLLYGPTAECYHCVPLRVSAFMGAL